METRAAIKFPPPTRQGTEGNSRHSERQTLACLLPGRAKDLTAPLYIQLKIATEIHVTTLFDVTQERCKLITGYR